MNREWNEIVREAGVMEGDHIKGIVVRHIPSMTGDDVVMCPGDEVKNRISSIAAKGPMRRMQPERVFLARTLRYDAETAIAFLVRAVMGHWIHARGKTTVEDIHEKNVWRMIEEHLVQKGERVDSTSTAGRKQVSDAYIKAPIAHDGMLDVVRKAMDQMVKQMAGRHVIVLGRSPLAI